MIKAKVENILWQKELEDLQEKFENLKPLNYSEIEQELKKYIVELDSDPSSTGVGRLNEQIAKVDGYISRTVTVLMDAIANKSVFSLLLKDVQKLYNDHLRTQLRKEDVAKLSNQNLRQAAAEEKIGSIGNFKHVVEKALDAAKTHEETCREKLKGLDITNKDISRQITVIQNQLEIGEIQRRASRSNNDF